MIIRLILACICGGIIGFERTRRLKEAGIRTHCIIASASALIMLVSQYGFSNLHTENGFFAGTDGADPSRIAAQIVCGISFIGAGVIFRNGNSVKGLTTAAGIWATAGVGMAIGCGMYIPGIVLTLIVLFIQFIFHRYSLGNDAYSETEVKIVTSGDGDFKKRFIDDNGKNIQILSIKTERNDNGVEYIIAFRPKNVYTAEDIEQLLSQYLEIKSISISG